MKINGIVKKRCGALYSTFKLTLLLELVLIRYLYREPHNFFTISLIFC